MLLGCKTANLHVLFISCLSGMQTIDACQAMFLPIGASISLLVMFLFFDSLQMVFAVCTASKEYYPSFIRRLNKG